MTINQLLAETTVWPKLDLPKITPKTADENYRDWLALNRLETEVEATKATATAKALAFRNYDNGAYLNQENGYQDCISGQSYSGQSEAYQDGWFEACQFLADRLAS